MENLLFLGVPILKHIRVYRFVSCNKNSVDGNVSPVKSTIKKQSLPYFFRYETEFFSLPKQAQKSRSILKDYSKISLD